MFYPVNLEHESVVIEHTGESILPDTKLLEWTASEWFEILARITPRVVYDPIAFRDDTVMDGVSEVIELFGGSGGELPRPSSSSSLTIRVVGHHRQNLFAGYEFFFVSYVIGVPTTELARPSW